MASSASPSQRDLLEERLLARMKATEKVYREAAAQHASVRREYGDVLNHQDCALHRFAEMERAALEQYTRALRVYANLVLHDRFPGPEDDPN